VIITAPPLPTVFPGAGGYTPVGRVACAGCERALLLCDIFKILI